MIAATMMSVLFVGLGSHLRGGLTVWQRTTETGERLQQQRVGLDRLQHDLLNAFVFDSRQDAYGPSSGQLPPPAFGQAQLAFYTIAPAATREPPTIRFVRYECSVHGDVTGLWRTTQSIGQARARMSEPVPELVLPGCETLSLRYAYLPPDTEAAQTGSILQWMATWPDHPEETLKLPRVMEITIHGAGSDVRRRYAIPVGIFGRVEAMAP